MTVEPKTSPPQLKLGTFLGVFTPTVLTILGVIMYLRLGWVVSTAGLWGAVAVIALSNIITLMTAFSMSTLATSMRVGGGGAYFLISRSFGLEVGGAIGIPLYVSQVLSVSLYAYGLAETLRILVDVSDFMLKVIAALIVVFVTAVAARSTEMTLKLQVPILGVIAVSIVALVLGIEGDAVQVSDWGPWEGAVEGAVEGTSPESVGFWAVFAVFFPAVTGLLTGLSLSGDLAQPSKSIPRGVLAAVLVGAVVYLSLPFLLARAGSAESLSDPLVWTTLAFGGSLFVMPGMWGAVLSSAFGSILSAPRTLQALAADRIVPDALAQNDPETGEPLNGIRLSGALAFVAVFFLNDLNTVASVVTVFFLTTYGALNGVACLETLIGDPAFRPRIRVPWFVPLMGFIGCFVAMFLIHPVACVVAILLEALLFIALSRRSLNTTWGDARSGLLLTGARHILLSLRQTKIDPRNWRPHILVFTTDLEVDMPLVRLADHVGQHRGIVTIVRLLFGDVEAYPLRKELVEQDMLRIKKAGVLAFPEISVVSDHDEGILTVAQANGFAGLDSNTVLLGLRDVSAPGAPGDLARLVTLTRKFDAMGKCTLIRCSRPSNPTQNAGPIVLWWAGRHNNGDLMLLLAHLMTVSSAWRRSVIHLKSIVSNEEEAEVRRAQFSKMLPDIRIAVKVKVIVMEEGRSTADLIVQNSAGAAIVMLGMKLADAGEEEQYAEQVHGLLARLPTTLLVRNAGEFRGRLI